MFFQISNKNIIASENKNKLFEGWYENIGYISISEDLEEKTKNFGLNIMCLTLVLFIFAYSEHWLGMFYMNINKIKTFIWGLFYTHFHFPLL